MFGHIREVVDESESVHKRLSDDNLLKYTGLIKYPELLD